MLRSTGQPSATARIAGFLAVCALLAGCGSGGSGSAAAPHSLASDQAALTLDAIPDLTNSGGATNSTYTLTVHNSRGTVHVVSTAISDTTVGRVESADAPLSVTLTPLAAGTAQVTVAVADDASTAQQTFNYNVTGTAQTLQLAAANTLQSAIQLTNTGDADRLIGLVHNGFPTFRTRQDVVDYVRAMPEEMPGEPFERKLWRFLIINTYHQVPFGSQTYLDDPMLMVNSLGWGFCGQVAASYVLIARQAGYQARVWGLNGHVVSEILVNGTWHMYDTDLYVYYFNRLGDVAGVDELADDSTLFTQPTTPIWPQYLNSILYSQTLANIYASTTDNFPGDVFVPTGPSASGLIDLPAHATLTYPGKWTDDPVGYDGTVPYTVVYYKQARLDVPSGYTGTISLPWMAWDIQGSGSVSIDGIAYAVGSPALEQVLQHGANPIQEIKVLNSSGVAIIFFVNALNYAMNAQNSVTISGVSISEIDAQVVTLSPQYQLNVANDPRKPVP